MEQTDIKFEQQYCHFCKRPGLELCLDCEKEFDNFGNVAIISLIIAKQNRVHGECYNDIILSVHDRWTFFGKCKYSHKLYQDGSRYEKELICTQLDDISPMDYLCRYHEVIKEFKEDYIQISGWYIKRKVISDYTYQKCPIKKCKNLVSIKEIRHRALNDKPKTFSYENRQFCQKHVNWLPIHEELKKRKVLISNKKHIMHFLWKY